jgi:hypothetical protein
MARIVVIAGIVITVCGLVACSRLPEPPAQKAEQKRPKVLHFYASPGVTARGDAVTMCYGVENADRVSIEPNIRELKPSPNRCFSFSPEKSAIYKLTAAGAGGEDSAQLAIEVKARAPAQPAVEPEGSAVLNLLVASAEDVAKGQPVTICYGVTEAISVRVEPPVRELQPRSSCFAAPVEKTTTFTVIAVDKANKEHRRQITVRVR